MKNSTKNIGILSGTFDPIHVGHIEFAIHAMSKGKLDEVYFLPERLPRTKQPVHFAHRIAMIKLAIKPYPKLKVMELPDRNFSVNRTLPEIKKLVGSDNLYFLFGTDKIDSINTWPNHKQFLNDVNIILLPTRDHKADEVKEKTSGWQSPPITLSIGQNRSVSSGIIRKDLMAGDKAKGLLESTERYIRENWLYISLDIRS